MKPVLPGAVIGILGGGQLGRMLALEARRMGYRTAVLDPAPRGPAAQAADLHIRAPVDDAEAALKLAAAADVVTVEWELIPAEVLRKVEKDKPLRPSSRVLEIIQDRLVQKEFLARHGFPQTPFEAVHDMAGLSTASERLGLPGVLKGRRHGYDGKGQLSLESWQDLSAAGNLLKAPCVLETKVAFEKEISVILARGQDGMAAVYPVAENAHRRGILHTTRAPAGIPETARRAAEELALAIAKALGHVGVMAVEMFLLPGGKLLVNEIAPRVHNSGHFTWDACAVSQFEQHLRAVCGLTLGETDLFSPAVMVNLLGDLWEKGEPAWEKILGVPNLKLHLYGKDKPAPGRKMGHLTLLGPDPAALLKQTEDSLALLG
ncbi:MAG: 5-(carboxyamino)imidazole ribonucleotide synthase [Elusimicrobia bacterium]|nr:5-(carboxyamino)imidazole ribonucleotide synthase [Elusimicrobiota bacterium]